MRKAMVLGVLGLAGTLASPAFADDQFRGFRLGVTMGQENLEGDVAYERLRRRASTPTASATAFPAAGDSTSGWPFEAGYNDGGEFNQDLEHSATVTGMTRVVAAHRHAWPSSRFGRRFVVDHRQFQRLSAAPGMYYWKGQTTFSEDLDTTIEIPASVP